MHNPRQSSSFPSVPPSQSLQPVRLPKSTGQYYQLNTLTASDATEQIKSLVVLSDPKAGVARSPSTVSVLSASSFSVQFTGLTSNARFTLLIAYGFAYLDVETTSYVQLIMISSQSVYNYATGTAQIETFALQNSYESSLGQFCLSNLSPYALTYLSQIDNIRNNVFSSPYLQSQKLILNGKWNGQPTLQKITEFVSNGFTYQLKSSIDIQFQELANTQIIIPLQFKRHIGAVFEKIDIDDFKISERPADPQELESLFERIRQETIFYKVSLDPNTAPVSQEYLTGAAAETNVAILMTYAYYWADFFDWYRNPMVRVIIKDGIIGMISISVAGLNYFTCPYGSLRSEIQHFTQGDSYHSIGYSSIHSIYTFAYDQKNWKINTQVNINTNGMVANVASLSNFENSLSCIDGNFKVTLSDNVLADYESFFTDNYMISKIDTRMSIQSIENFTLLYVDDLGSEFTGPLITPESFVGDLQFNPGFCDETIGTGLGNQLSYYFSSSDFSVERFPEYSTRLSYENGVSYLSDTNSVGLKYSNHEYLQDFSIEIDQSILLYKEPKVSSVNFTLIPNRSEWNEMNATIQIFSFNSGDWGGEFTVELTCSYPIIISNNSPQKFNVEPGQNFTAFFTVKSDFDSCKTVSLQSVCDFKISIKKEQLWTNLEKEISAHESVAIDYGYFIPRCQAKYNEPFLWLENMTLSSPYFQRSAHDGFVNSILVVLKTNSSDLILSNIASGLLADSNNPFHSWKDYSIIMQHAEYYMLNFTISSTNVARILSERVDQTLYTFSLNLTLLDNYICWSTNGKGGIFPFSFSVAYDCPIEYTGIQCDIPLCYGINATNYTNVCSGHGDCVSPDYCSCHANYTSATCSVPICYGVRGDNLSTCSSKGSCIDANTCTCQNGYTGVNCEIPICFNVPANFSHSCYGHGNCIDHDLCSCNDGYTASLNCSLPICYGLDSSQLIVCSSHGQCLAPNNCSCFDGFTFDNCSIPICYNIDASNSSVCTGFGECYSPNNCKCHENHIGLQCEIPICFGVPSNETQSCNGNGQCIQYNECVCHLDYTGLNCSIPICFGSNATNPTVCSSHGVCQAPDQCQCHEGYTGIQCEIPICFNIPATNSSTCSFHGECIDHNLCTCHDGYTAALNCSLPICYGLDSSQSMVCSSHGQCLAPNNCTCFDGFTFDNCSIPICYNIDASNSSVCSGFGECYSPNNCKCHENHIGLQCEIPICFGVPSNETQACNGNGQCIQYNECVCHSDYTGIDCSIPICFGINATNQSHVCFSHGICQKPDQCQCHEGYTGMQCEIPICFNIPAINSSTCSFHGECIDFNHCSCHDGYTASLNCSLPICYGLDSSQLMVCSSHGQCLAPNNCSCYEGYTAENCSIPICYNIDASNSSVCSGFGECTFPNNCKCHENHVGLQCEIPLCFGVPSNETQSCNGNGQCVQYNECVCHSNYTGIDCSIPLCFNINATNPTVCSSHGICQSPDQCQCHEGYTGMQCEIPICFNISANDSSTCSSHGECIDFMIFHCHDGYTSANCSIPICYGLDSSQSMVCSSHGQCLAPNNCTCFDGFTSDNCSIPICYNIDASNSSCEIPLCFGVPSNETQSCNGNGQCVQYNECVCHSNYTGIDCSIPLCFNINATNPTVCSSHGICQSPDQCQCHEGYTGMQCEIPICFNISANDSSTCSSHGECIDHDLLHMS
ncbi:predicted protein [Naegleria gruberi]|uniref:Predicted protein n=1 Tax=Naegleria gruberi TaxID=5762 RepID=D2V061_NAEGR|nr:uncharacterized protein NAEGRDRAFT_62182 [Naegleria gruberi]EFC49472.1 predicted protein [Naegleria gruberi]|eukprot:XP_002682216.1 predicted protein [Naegleria gruberi strain NEG-M]